MSIWDKQDYETAKAYLAFTYYLRLGPKRSLDRAVQLYCADTGIEHTNGRRSWWGNWSAKHNWVARSEAHDADQTRKEFDSAESNRMRAFALAGKSAEGLLAKLIRIGMGTHTSGRGQVAALKHALALAGVDVPKLVEISGRGGDPVRIQTDVAKKIDEAIAGLSDDQRDALEELDP